MSKQQKLGKCYLFFFGVILAFIAFYSYTGLYSSQSYEDSLNELELNAKVKINNPTNKKSEENIEISKVKSERKKVNIKNQVSINDTLRDPTVRKIVPYKLGDQNVNWVEWENRCVMPTDVDAQFERFSQLVCS